MLYLRTKYGNEYHVTEQGDIIRLDLPGFQPSGQWRMLGIQHVSRNEFIPFAQLTKERCAQLTMRYKNGNPQWTVRDLDHGSTRVWGNTRVHGLIAVSVI